MTKQTINIGATAGDGTGDTLRTAGAKLNSMFSELYTAIPSQPMRVVAAGQRAGNGFQTAPTGKLSFSWRDQNILGGPIANFIPAFINWANVAKVDTQNPNSVTITATWITRVATGQVIPITFGGSRSFTMPASGTAVRYLADAIPVIAWTGQPVLPGEIFIIDGKGTVPAAANTVPSMRHKAAAAGSFFYWFDPAGDTTGMDYTGTYTAPSGATSVANGFSAILAGTFTRPGFVSLGGIGDSIAEGLAESGAQTNIGQGPIEMINRLDTSVSFIPAQAMIPARVFATLLCAQSGDRYPTNLAASWPLRAALLGEMSNVLIDEMGANSFQSASTGNPTNTAAAIETLAEAAWAYFRSFQPGLPIIKTKLLPITTSNPVGGPTKASQTPAYDFASGGPVDQWHTMLKAAKNAGKIDAFIDTRAPVSDPSDEHYWISNGTANYYVAESGTDPTPLTHPYAQTSILMAAVIRPFVTAYDGRVS